MTTHRLDFVLTAVADAPTYRPVLARVRDEVATRRRRPCELGESGIEGRWGVEVDVCPPGYEWQPPLL